MRRVFLSAFCLASATSAFAETVPCPTQLEESHNQALIIAQSRDSTEQRLAQAIRANKELSAAFKKVTDENKKLQDDLKAAKEPPKEGQP